VAPVKVCKAPELVTASRLAGEWCPPAAPLPGSPAAVVTGPQLPGVGGLGRLSGLAWPASSKHEQQKSNEVCTQPAIHACIRLACNEILERSKAATDSQPAMGSVQVVATQPTPTRLPGRAG
jgi:hypothetical protein